MELSVKKSVKGGNLITALVQLMGSSCATEKLGKEGDFLQLKATREHANRNVNSSQLEMFTVKR